MGCKEDLIALKRRLESANNTILMMEQELKRMRAEEPNLLIAKQKFASEKIGQNQIIQQTIGRHNEITQKHQQEIERLRMLIKETGGNPDAD